MSASLSYFHLIDSILECSRRGHTITNPMFLLVLEEKKKRSILWLRIMLMIKLEALMYPDVSGHRESDKFNATT